MNAAQIAEIEQIAENPFTSAIRALSRLYAFACDTNNASLATRTEAATRELLAWHDDARQETKQSTRVDFPPREQEVTR